MSDSRAIGIFDSGLGGLTVAKEIIKLLPYENIVYFGDTGRIPYGTKGFEVIKKYAAQDARFLLRHNVKAIVAACGTVSSVVTNLADMLPVDYFEVVSHSVYAAVRATKNKKIGVLATAATIRSGAHRQKILSLLPDAEVVQSSGSLLVSLVEEGWTDKNDNVVKETVSRYVEPFKKAGVDTVILGCTHFPILCETIKSEMGEGVSLINMGTATAEALKASLAEKGKLNASNISATHEFFVSDKTESFKKTASILLGEEIDENAVEQVDIDKL